MGSASPLSRGSRCGLAPLRSSSSPLHAPTSRMTYPAEGTVAPDFTLDTDAGTPLTLSALRGRPIVLFFYPKDDTPGCTIESCEFRDLMPRFQGVKAEVLGVSPDDVKSHVKFRKKFDLPYSLLADVEHEVAEAYGVWQEKSMFALKYMGNAR